MEKGRRERERKGKRQANSVPSVHSALVVGSKEPLSVWRVM